MSTFVFLSVLAAALMHAVWNALIKVGRDRLGGMMAMSLLEAAIALPVILLSPWPAAAVWPWLVVSGLVHTGYKLALVLAYSHGDLSRVYPISRGAAPLLVLLIGAFLLTDRLTMAEIAGIVVLGTGILIMARGVFGQNEPRRLLPYALLAAATTAAYTLIDGHGARISGDAMAYVAWMFLLDCLFFQMVFVIRRRRIVPQMPPRAWLAGMMAAVASYGAYLIAVWAMTRAPIALVAALRETSILFAVLIGWLLFGDRMHRGKAVAAALIVAGVVLTRL